MKKNPLYFISRILIGFGLINFIFGWSLKLLFLVGLCRPYEDLMSGFGGICEFLSMGKLMIFIMTGWGQYNILFPILVIAGTIIAIKEVKMSKRNIIKDPFTYLVILYILLYLIPWSIILR